MEETKMTIHTGLMRRNIFLRENPVRWQFVAEARRVWPTSFVTIGSP